MPTLGDLSNDVLCNIMAVSDQATRVACLTSTKALSRAVLTPGVWDSVTFADLDVTALEFMDVHRVPTVYLRTCCPDDVSWFLGRVADQGIDCIRTLDIEISGGYRMNTDFLDPLVRLPGLETVRLVMKDIEREAELAFPRHGGMPNLRHLEIIEVPGEELVKKHYVFFNGTHRRFPSLERLTLDVCGSDVMTGLCHMRRLRRLAYLADEDSGDETYEDAEMEGCVLDELVIEVSVDTDYLRLCSELSKASVKRLVLCVGDSTASLMHPISEDIQAIALRFNCAHAEVCLDYPFLQSYKSLRSISVEYTRWVEEMVPVALKHTIEFRHVPNVQQFCGWLADKVHNAHARILCDPF